jgi:sporulation protein YlmC with PRC-barrel domain
MANELRDLLGRDVLASDGARLGHVADVYIDPDTGAPRWLVLPGGILTTGVSFVPADGAGRDEDGRLVVGYTRKQVRKAPHPDADGDLTPEEEAALARHYVAAARAVTEHRNPIADPTLETDLRDVGADAEDETDEWLVHPGPSDTTAMVRAEEGVRADTTPRADQRARLIKRVVTEHVTFTVPVRREVLHLVYEDIPDGEAVAIGAGEPFSPMAEQEFVLYGEIVEYEKKIVPKERVRLQKELVEEVVDLRTDLRKEEIDVAGGTAPPTYR